MSYITRFVNFVYEFFGGDPINYAGVALALLILFFVPRFLGNGTLYLVWGILLLTLIVMVALPVYQNRQAEAKESHSSHSKSGKG